MTSARVRLVERVIADFNEGDDGAVAAAIHPEARIYPESQLGSGTVLEGPSGVRAWIAAMRGSYREIRMRPVDLTEHRGRVAGDILVVVGPSEAGGGWRISFAMWFEDDQISEIRLFWHRDDALAALSGDG